MTRNQKEKIDIMREGGKKLAFVKSELVKMAKPGVSFEAMEAKAQELIKASGSLPSFSTVDDYKWATCITKNDGCCHGIPKNHTVEDKDILKIDVGLIWKTYHVDTTTTVYIGDESKADPAILQFIKDGWDILEESIAKAQIGNSVYDISHTMETGIESRGYGAVYQLTGHAIGHTLHEDPQIPCVAYRSDKKHKLFEGQTICVEVMDTMGDAKLKLGEDGWTYETVDGSMTGMFEETVLITSRGPEVLTR